MSDGSLDRLIPAEASASPGAHAGIRDCLELMRKAAHLIDLVSLAEDSDADSATAARSGDNWLATAEDLRLFRLGGEAIIRVATGLRDDDDVPRELHDVRRDLNRMPAQAVEVDTDRWLPRRDPFTITREGHQIRRTEDSGERTQVRYRLVDDGVFWLFQIRLRLVAGPNVEPNDLSQIRSAAQTGLTRLPQAPLLKFPGGSRRLEIDVEFVDADEHAAITVVQDTGPVMDQATWLVDSTAEDIVHEILHLLGVVHQVTGDAGLRPRTESGNELLLGPEARQQIVEVALPFLAPDAHSRPIAGRVGADPVSGDAFDALPRVGPSAGVQEQEIEMEPIAGAESAQAARRSAIPEARLDQRPGGTSASVPEPVADPERAPVAIAPSEQATPLPAVQTEAATELAGPVPVEPAPLPVDSAPVEPAPVEPAPVTMTPVGGSQPDVAPLEEDDALARGEALAREEAQERERLHGLIHGMRSERILSTLPSDGDPTVRSMVEEELEDLQWRLDHATGEDLRDLEERVQALTLKLLWWRRLLAETGRAGGMGWPTERQRPKRAVDRTEPDYDSTVQRAFQLRSRLAAEWEMPPGPDIEDELDRREDERSSRAAMARTIDAAVAWLYGSALAADGDELIEEAIRDWRDDVAVAHDRLFALLREVEHAMTRQLPPWEPAMRDRPDWEPRRRYAPGMHLTPGNHTRPALAREVVQQVSRPMRLSMVEAVLSKLPASLAGRPSTREQLEETLLGEAVLAADGADLISDGIRIVVDGHIIMVGAWLGGWRQDSDVFVMRPKSVNNVRRRMGRDLSHSWFLDTNTNLSWTLDVNGPRARIPVTESTYAGLLTVLLGEHEESRGDITVNQTEHTAKGSSYRSLLFTFAARPWIEIQTPDGATITSHGFAEVQEAVLLLASRESTLETAGDGPHTVVHADPDRLYQSLDGDWTRPPIPFNSVIEAIPSASTIRQMAEVYVFPDGRAAAGPQTLVHRKLASALRPGMLRSGLHEALLDRQGYRIDFGGIGGESSASLGIHIELGTATPVTLFDNRTWADMSRLQRTAIGHEQVSADVIDIPPGLLLSAATLVFGQRVSFEPYLFAWPDSDMLIARAGVGVDVTASSGLRMTAVAQTVLRFTARVKLTRSDQPDAPSAEFDLPGGILVRMAFDDARRWVDIGDERDHLPPDHPVEPSPQLRLSKAKYLPPIMQISDVAFAPSSGPGATAEAAPAAEPVAPVPAAEPAAPVPAGPAVAVDLVERVLSMLRRDFPGTVPHEDGSATRFEGAVSRRLADSRQARENLETVIRHLRTANLPNLAMQMATADGFSFRLTRKDISARLGDEVVVRVRAPLFRQGADGQPEMWQSDGRWVDKAEMDTFISTSEDLTHASSRTFGFWLGVEPLVSLSTSFVSWLTSIEPRPLIRGRIVRTSTKVSGYDVSGLRGVSVDEAAQFQVPVAFQVRVEAARRLLPVDLTGMREENEAMMPATFVEEQPIDEERGTAHPEDPDAAGRALPRVIDSEWILAQYTMLVPAELTEQLLDDGTWVSRTVARLIKEEKVPPHTRTLTGAGGRALEHYPQPADPLPRRVLVMTNANGLPKASIKALTEVRAGIVLTPAQRSELDGALAAKVKQAHSLLGSKPREVWSGRVGLLHTATVSLRFVPDKLVTRGVAEGYGTFTEFGAASIAGLGSERQRGGLVGLRARWAIDAGGTADVSPEEGNVPLQLVSYQPQIVKRLEFASGDSNEDGGFTARSAIEIGKTVLADITGYFEVTAEVKHRLTGAHEPGRPPQRVNTEGLAAMSELVASQLRLMPAGMEVELDKTVTYVLPDHVRQSQGLGGWIAEAPDISDFIDEIVKGVRTRFGPSVAGELAEELDKLTDPDVTASTLDLFFGGFRQTVAASRFQRVGVPFLEATVPLVPGGATVTVTIRAEYDRDEFLGVSPSQHYLGRSLSTEQVARQRSTRNSRLAVDPIRGWLRRFPNQGPLNSEWYQFNITAFGQTNRETSLATGRETGQGLTIDTGSAGRGAAVFNVFLTLSASVTVATTPAAAVDAVTLGFAQTNTTLPVFKRTLLEPVNVMYDPSLLESTVAEVTDVDAPQVAVPGSPAAPTAPAARPIRWGPLNRHNSQQDLWDLVRTGRKIDPALLNDAVADSMFDLDLVRERVHDLGKYPTAGPDGSLLGRISALWRTNGIGNASWYNSRAFHEDFIDAIINRAFLLPRIKALLTTGVIQPVRLPGRFQQTEAQLELVADVVAMWRGRSTDDGQSRQVSQETSLITTSTDVVAGTSISPWASLDVAVPGYRHFRPDRNNAVGPLQGLDFIQADGDRASLRTRTGTGQALKTTGRSFTELHLLVHWTVGIRTSADANRIYSTDAMPRRLVLLVPSEVVTDILRSPMRSTSLVDVSDRDLAALVALGPEEPPGASTVDTWLGLETWEESEHYLSLNMATLTEPTSRAYLHGLAIPAVRMSDRNRIRERRNVHYQLLNLAGEGMVGLGFQYLRARTPGTGINDVFTPLLALPAQRRLVTLETIKAIVAADQERQTDERQATAMIDAVLAMLNGKFEVANRIVEDVRRRMSLQDRVDWIDILRHMGDLPEFSQHTPALRELIVECTGSSSRPGPS